VLARLHERLRHAAVDHDGGAARAVATAVGDGRGAAAEVVGSAGAGAAWKTRRVRMPKIARSSDWDAAQPPSRPVARTGPHGPSAARTHTRTHARRASCATPTLTLAVSARLQGRSAQGGRVQCPSALGRGRDRAQGRGRDARGGAGQRAGRDAGSTLLCTCSSTRRRARRAGVRGWAGLGEAGQSSAARAPLPYRRSGCRCSSSYSR